jgi:hypothetical protein
MVVIDFMVGLILRGFHERMVFMNLPVPTNHHGFREIT